MKNFVKIVLVPTKAQEENLQRMLLMYQLAWELMMEEHRASMKKNKNPLFFDKMIIAAHQIRGKEKEMSKYISEKTMNEICMAHQRHFVRVHESEKEEKEWLKGLSRGSTMTIMNSGEGLAMSITHFLIPNVGWVKKLVADKKDAGFDAANITYKNGTWSIIIVKKISKETPVLKKKEKPIPKRDLREYNKMLDYRRRIAKHAQMNNKKRMASRSSGKCVYLVKDGVPVEQRDDPKKLDDPTGNVRHTDSGEGNLDF
jgi:hypothetical protein